MAAREINRVSDLTSEELCKAMESLLKSGRIGPPPEGYRFDYLLRRLIRSGQITLEELKEYAGAA
jgi:hypothetical protein